MSKHHHHHHQETSGKRMVITMLLNFSISIVEIIGGLISGSLSLISDALHNFSDGIAIIISYFALRLSHKDKTEFYTFGFKRAQILAAIINSGILLAISVYLVIAAFQKWLDPQPINGILMLIVASFGLVANLIGTVLLSQGAKNNMNIRSAYLHLLSDAVSSVAVILGAIAITYYEQYWIDPVLTLLIATYIGWESWKIVQEAVNILMFKVPTGMSLDALQNSLKKINHIENVHHIHLWQLDEHDIHFQAHIKVTDALVSSTEEIAKAIEHCLHHQFGINHVTLQFETDQCITGLQTTNTDCDKYVN